MLLKSVLFLIYVSIADSESLDDCSATLNHSDCGLRPIMVYTSFSPMAMCHPAIWRGCPTKNKFVTEYQCMQFCLANNEVKKDRCDVPINTGRCSDLIKEVYTFSVDQKACVKTVWHGCNSENIFTDETSCMNACTSNMDWVDTLANMDISEVKETSNLLNAIIKKLVAPKNIQKTEVDDNSAKAYFIRKLQKVNRELDARTENAYTDLMLMDV